MLVDVVNHRLCGEAVNLAWGNALGLGFGRGTLFSCKTQILWLERKGLFEYCLWEPTILPSSHSQCSDKEVMIWICHSRASSGYWAYVGLKECMGGLEKSSSLPTGDNCTLSGFTTQLRPLSAAHPWPCCRPPGQEPLRLRLSLSSFLFLPSQSPSHFLLVPSFFSPLFSLLPSFYFSASEFFPFRDQTTKLLTCWCSSFWEMDSVLCWLEIESLSDGYQKEGVFVP